MPRLVTVPCTVLTCAPLSGAFRSAAAALESTSALGVFKPDRRVYGLVGEYFGCSAGEVLFVSSNCWDACAASGYGFTAVWANRAGEPMDRLPWKPADVGADLTGIPGIAAA